MQIGCTQEDAVHRRVDVAADGEIVLLARQWLYLVAREVERILSENNANSRSPISP